MSRSFPAPCSLADRSLLTSNVLKGLQSGTIVHLKKGEIGLIYSPKSGFAIIPPLKPRLSFRSVDEADDLCLDYASQMIAPENAAPVPASCEWLKEGTFVTYECVRNDRNHWVATHIEKDKAQAAENIITSSPLAFTAKGVVTSRSVYDGFPSLLLWNDRLGRISLHGSEFIDAEILDTMQFTAVYCGSDCRRREDIPWEASSAQIVARAENFDHQLFNDVGVSSGWSVYKIIDNGNVVMKKGDSCSFIDRDDMDASCDLSCIGVQPCEYTVHNVNQIGGSLEFTRGLLARRYLKGEHADTGEVVHVPGQTPWADLPACANGYTAMSLPATQLDVELDRCIRGNLDIDECSNRVTLLYHLVQLSVPSEGSWILITDLLAGMGETDAFVDAFAPRYVDTRVGVREKGLVSIAVYNVETNPVLRVPLHPIKRALAGGNPAGIRVCRDYNYAGALSCIHRFHPRCIIWECMKIPALGQLRRTLEHVVFGAQRTENIVLIVDTEHLGEMKDYVVRAFGNLDPFNGPDKVVVASKAQLHQLHAARGGTAVQTVNPGGQGAVHHANAPPIALVSGPSSDVSTAGSIVAGTAAQTVNPGGQGAVHHVNAPPIALVSGPSSDVSTAGSIVAGTAAQTVNPGGQGAVHHVNAPPIALVSGPSSDVSTAGSIVAGTAAQTVNPGGQGAVHHVNAPPIALVSGPSSDVSTAGSIVAGTAAQTVNPGGQGAVHHVNAPPIALVSGPSSDVSTAGSIVARTADRESGETNIMGERSDDEVGGDGASSTSASSSVLCATCSQLSGTNMNHMVVFFVRNRCEAPHDEPVPVILTPTRLTAALAPTHHFREIIHVNEPVDWARSMSPGPHFPSLQQLDKLFTDNAFRGHNAAGLAEYMFHPVPPEPVSRVASHVNDHVIFIHGQSQSGKSAMVPYLASALAERSRELWLEELKRAPANASELFPSDMEGSCLLTGEAFLSRKFIVVCGSANQAAAYRKRLLEIYTDKFLVNSYQSVAGDSPSDLMVPMHAHGLAKNTTFTGSWNSYMSVPGIIVDISTAISLVELGGFIGTLVIDNCENYDNVPQLSTLLSIALSKCKYPGDPVPGSIGTIVLMTTDRDKDAAWMDRIQGRISTVSNKVSFGRLFMPDTSTQLIPDPLPFSFHCIQTPLTMGNVRDESREEDAEILASVNIERGAPFMNAATQLLWQQLRSARPHDSTLVLQERDGPNVTCDVPAMEWNRTEVEVITRKVLNQIVVDLDIDNVPPHPAPVRTLRIPHVMVVVGTREQVAAVGHGLMRADEFFIPRKEYRLLDPTRPTGRGNKLIKEHSDKAFAMIRMGEPWKYDTITNSNVIDVMHVNVNVYDVDETNANLARGRVIILTHQAAMGIELAGVTTVIMAMSMTLPRAYRSNGVVPITRHFLDGSILKRVMSRIGRRRDEQGKKLRVVYAGTEFEFVNQFGKDRRDFRLERNYDMRTYIREKCVKEGRMTLFNHPLDATFREDAWILGVLSQTSTRFLQLAQSMHTLMIHFPFLDTRMIHLLVLGVKCRVAMQAVGIVAHEMCGGRFLQQSETPASSSFREGYGSVHLIAFMEAVERYMSHTNRSGGLPVIHPGYRSAAVATGDFLASAIEGTFWQPEIPEDKYQTFVGDRDNEKYTRLRRTSYFSCDWWKVPGAKSNQAFNHLHASTNYAHGLNYVGMYKACFRDEGREMYHQALRMISKGLIACGLIKFEHRDNLSFMHEDYNKYKIDRESVLLNSAGQSLLSGILTMTMSNVAQLDKRVPNDAGARYSKRLLYAVHTPDADTNKSFVKGALLGDPRKAMEYAMYAPSDAYSENVDRSDSVYALVHPVRAPHVLLMANSLATFLVYEDFDEHGVPKHDDVTFGVWLTGIPPMPEDKAGVPCKLMTFKVASAKEHMNRVVDYVNDIRSKFRNALSMCLTRDSVEFLEQDIIKIWELYSA